MKIDISAQTHQKLTQARSELPYLRPEFVFPRYDGFSVANIAASVAGWLGAEAGENQLPPLQDAGVFGSDFDHVVIVLIDGVGET